MVLGYATRGLEGADPDQGLNSILTSLGAIVNNLIDPPTKRSISAAQKGKSNKA